MLFILLSLLFLNSYKFRIPYRRNSYMNLNIRKRKRTFPQNNFWRKVLIFNRFLSGIVQSYPSVEPIILHINLRICCSKRCSKPTSYPLKPLILLTLFIQRLHCREFFWLLSLLLYILANPWKMGFPGFYILGHSWTFFWLLYVQKMSFALKYVFLFLCMYCCAEHNNT